MIVGAALNHANSHGTNVLIKDNTASGKADAWKEAMASEARAVNPLHDVNSSRNQLIQDAVKTDDWSEYNEYQAKQHPAWYNTENGEAVKNKEYWAELAESRAEALKQAEAENDQEDIKTWESALESAVENLKKAPGEMPHIPVFANGSKLAEKYDIEPASDSWFDSKYNDPLVSSQGKFSNNAWYNNPYFEENPESLEKTLAAVEEHGSSEQIEKANEVNKELLARMDEEEAEKENDVETAESQAGETVSIRDLQTNNHLQQALQGALASDDKLDMSVQDYLLQNL
ncbi:hypothetical protein [Alteribacillus sp. YIM 98480]|uniref:hypothetical protein n=1 Tax=Alteribacillus sp. YIM 98480 TaxID=2606599 RepID=UPI00131C7791|nr:hypothetical protein [Alteribacillus sp. YIM 98480]